jgi:hypothetical protein
MHYKTLSTAILSVALFSKSAIAQTTLMPKIGYHRTTIVNAADKAADARLDLPATNNFFAGVEANLPLFSTLGVTTGLHYAHMGQNYINRPDLIYQIASITTSIKLNYLRVPLLISYGFKSGKLHHAIGIGGYYAKLLSYQEHLNTTYKPANTLLITVLEQQYSLSENDYSLNYADRDTAYKVRATGSKPKFRLNDLGFTARYDVSYPFTKQLGLMAGASLFLGQSQVDEIDSITLTLTSDPTQQITFSILSTKYARNNLEGGALPGNQEPRDPASHNLSYGLYFGISYKLNKDKQ